MMKIKKLEKKLLLNKSTVSNLDIKKMSRVYGGGETKSACITDCQKTLCTGCCK